VDELVNSGLVPFQIVWKALDCGNEMMGDTLALDLSFHLQQR
jgi:hypothetical protein